MKMKNSNSMYLERYIFLAIILVLAAAIVLLLLSKTQLNIPIFSSGTCTDSDGGKNYVMKGNTCSSGECLTDYCSGNVLTEGYCDGGIPFSLNFTCPDGYQCTDGACNKIPVIENEGIAGSNQDQCKTNSDCPPGQRCVPQRRCSPCASGFNCACVTVNACQF
jgi:hypothetical protein